MFCHFRLISLAAGLLLILSAGASLQAADKLIGLPDGANVVLSLSLKELREQPEFDKNLQGAMDRIKQMTGGEKDPLAQIKDATGVDIVKDVDSAAIAIYLPADFQTMRATAQRPVFIAILNGKYNSAGLLKNLEAIVTSQSMAVQKSDYQGVAIQSMKGPMGREVCWCLNGQAFVVSTALANLQKSLDAIKAGASPASDAKLKPYLSDIKQTCPFYAAGYLPEGDAPTSASAAGQPGQNPVMGPAGRMMEFAKTLKGFALSYDGKDGGTDVNAKITSKDAASAALIKNAVDGWRGMVGMATMRQNPNMDPKMQENLTKVNQFLQKLTVTLAEEKVSIAFKLTKDETNDLKTVVESMAGMGMTARRAMGAARGGGAGGFGGRRGQGGAGPGAAPGKPASGAPAAGF